MYRIKSPTKPVFSIRGCRGKHWRRV